MVQTRVNITKAVIPVAGLGTRFFPVTRTVPKALLPVLSKPLIQYAVEDAVEAGITEIAIVEDARSVASYFDPMPALEHELRDRGRGDLADQQSRISGMARVETIKQLEPLGLGHAVWLARNFVKNEPFVVILPDELLWAGHSSTAQILDVRDRYGGSVIGVMETSWDDVHTKGIVAGRKVEDNVIAIDEMVEKPPRDEAPSNLAIVGRYVLRPEIFEHLRTGTRGAGNEIQLTDAIVKCMEDSPVYGAIIEGDRFDAGVPEGMFGASLYQASKNDATRQMILDLAEKLAAAD